MKEQNLMEKYSDLFKMGVNTSKVITELINIGKSEAIKDIKTTRRCMNFMRLKCQNKDCSNKSCPLNKEYD